MCCSEFDTLYIYIKHEEYVLILFVCHTQFHFVNLAEYNVLRMYVVVLS